jgi:hypothetical protein
MKAMNIRKIKITKLLLAPSFLRSWMALILALGISVLCSLPAQAQLSKGDEFQFVRIRFTDNGIRYGYGFSTNAPVWAHDYPQAEDNLYTALKATTSFKIAEETKVLTFSDDEIFNYPFIYACEIGYLTLSEDEVKNLREYLLRGGFLMVDDFRGYYEMQNWLKEIGRVLPEFQQKQLSVSHPIFHCFFDLTDIYKLTPYLEVPPQYLGIFDDSDRLMVLVNFNNDVGDGWELPHETPDFSTESFKLGINYLIYSYTH